MKVYNSRSGRQLPRRRVICCTPKSSSLGMLADLLSQRSALLDYIRKNDGFQDAKMGEIASMKFELQHVQAQIDAMNSGEAAPSQESTVSKLEASVGQVARQAISAQDQEGVTLTCGHAESGTVSGCWAVVVAPYIAEGKKRLQASLAFTMPDTTGLKPADVALVWGLAHDGNSPWHEPPPGWSTEPPVSWDIAHGAWGTRSAVLGEVPATGATSAPVYGVLIDVPWKASMRKYSGIAFKWTVKAGKDKLWFGDVSGGNLSVRTSFAKLVLSGSGRMLLYFAQHHVQHLYECETHITTKEDSDSDDGPPQKNTSDKDEPSDLLTGLSRGQVTALRTTRSEGPHPPPTAFAASIESAVDPWMQAASASGREQHVAHDSIGGMGHDEHKACRSLMHRYDIAQNYVQRIDWPRVADVEQAVKHLALSNLMRGPSAADNTPAPLQGVLQHAAAAEGQLMAVAVWLRLAAARLLVWNHNYNVKPREISTSQQNVTSAVAHIWKTCPWARKTAVMVLATVGRGGDGNQGQRIRDEILSIQSRNGCKGGMMEQWHQKLHNNTSPDDVEICRALIAYLESDLDIKEYWRTLHAAGIDEARLASFDRSITQKPSFSKQQVPQLLKDLQAYLVTLCAVHGGLDLQSAALPVLGYSQVKRKGRSVHVDPVAGFNTERLRKLVQSLMALQQRSDSEKEAVTAVVNDGPRAKLQLAVQKMELCMEARNLCSDYLTGDAECERARDVLHLDIVLTGTVRTIIEATLDYWLTILKDISSSTGQVTSGDAVLLLQMCNYATANYAQLQPGNEHAVACARELQQASGLLQDTRDAPQKVITWNLQVLLAIAQRLGRVITHDSSRTLEQMEATCRPLASAVNVDKGAAQVAIEDAVRAMPHAPLAQLLSPLELTLQKLLDGSMWRIVSPMQSGSVTGRLRFEKSLAAVQDLELEVPTIIIAEQVGGEEDLPKGAVGLLCMQNIDVLCHAALRARATGAFLACCLDKDILSDLNSSLCGQQVCLTMDGQDVVMSQAANGHEYSAPLASTSAAAPTGTDQGLTVPPLDYSEWVVEQGVDEQHVGSKCVNLWRMSKMMSSQVPVPEALALPYSAWPKLLSLPENRSLATALHCDNIAGTDVEEHVLKVAIPEDLVKACSDATDKLTGKRVSGNDAVMHAIKQVWASKYGERARRACSFLNVPLSSIHMSVVLQPLVNASMAFVSHTQDPRQLQASSETGACVQQMYIEAVVGLGESLVGNVDGQPLSCTVDSQALLQNLQDAVQSGRVQGANLRCLGQSAGTVCDINLAEWISELPKSDFEAAAACVRVLTASSKAWMVVPGTGALDAPRGSPDLHYGIIARSASNMEDLQSYSGAGVFDSFPTAGSLHCVAESLSSWRGGFAELEHRLMAMAIASLEVKACLDEGDMDVEGVIDAFGNVHVVQARPQV